MSGIMTRIDELVVKFIQDNGILASLHDEIKKLLIEFGLDVMHDTNFQKELLIEGNNND